MISNITELPTTIKSQESINDKVPTKESRKADYVWEIVWERVIFMSYVHLAGLYGVYLICFQPSLWTIVWHYIIGVAGGLGITAGAHRLWAHRSYKAKWSVKLLLTIFQTIASQGHIYTWVRDHRMHHKFTDTDADPYNARRGFFFSHIGWLLVRKHPAILNKRNSVDCSDLEQDPFVVFQRRWYWYLMLCCFILPTVIPWWIWGESIWYSWHLTVWRYFMGLNGTWSVNSVAHMWGMKPYDKSFSSTDNAGVSLATFGEGWHNYHHVFPWDYKAAELGNYRLNMTTAFIDFLAYLGLIYDLKTVPANVVNKRVLRSGRTNY